MPDNLPPSQPLPNPTISDGAFASWSESFGTEPLLRVPVEKPNVSVDVPKEPDPKPEVVVKAEEKPVPVEPSKPAGAIPEPKGSAAANFRALREKVEAKDREVAELRAALEKTGKPNDNEALVALQKENESLSARLAELDIERHPKFQEHYDGRIGKKVAMAKSIVGEHGDKLEQILRLPDGAYRNTQLDELYGELSPRQQAQIGALDVELRELQLERASEIQKSGLTRKQLQEADTAQVRARLEKAKSEFEQVLALSSDPTDGLPAYQPRDGDAAWNAKVADRVQLSRAIYMGELPASDLARASVWAAAAPALLDEIVGRDAKIQELEGQLARYKTTTPGIGGSVEETSGEPKATGDFRNDAELRARGFFGK